MRDAALVSHLSMLQLSDSGFPSGRYTLSYGLEALAQSRMFDAGPGEETLTRVLSDHLRFGVGPSDGVALACAHRAVAADISFDMDRATAADKRLTAVKLARESRVSSMRTGRALLNTAGGIIESTVLRHYAEQVRRGHAPGNHAVVVGLVSVELGVPTLMAVAGELYAFGSSWVAAAVRLGLTDHRTAQRVLHRIRPVTAAAARAAEDGDVGQIRSCAPLLDVMCMRHEEAELRLFAS